MQRSGYWDRLEATHMPYSFLPSATTLPGSVLPVESPPSHHPQVALPIVSSACILSVLPSGSLGTSFEKHITQEHWFPNVGRFVPGSKSRLMKIFYFPNDPLFWTPFCWSPFSTSSSEIFLWFSIHLTLSLSLPVSLYHFIFTRTLFLFVFFLIHNYFGYHRIVG